MGERNFYLINFIKSFRICINTLLSFRLNILYFLLLESYYFFIKNNGGKN